MGRRRGSGRGRCDGRGHLGWLGFAFGGLRRNRFADFWFDTVVNDGMLFGHAAVRAKQG